MPFRASFDCLWCGTPHETRTPEDIEGWAQLCPACVGRAGDNAFLRFRLKAALEERSRAQAGGAMASEVPAATRRREAPTSARPEPAPDFEPAAAGSRSGASERAGDADLVAYYEARAPEYDDWYLRRGRYDHGPIANAVWQSELDRATLWLDSLPLGPVIVELAAGTGWWSPLLAQKGELWAFDAAEAPLERARRRLLAHGLRAHLHVRDAWSTPDRTVDAVFCGFWLSHVERDRLAAFLAIVRRWLRPGGSFAFVDSRPDPESGAVDHDAPRDDRATRRLDDGRTFVIPKVYWTPAELEAALAAAGFHEIEVASTGRFFVIGRATA